MAKIVTDSMHYTNAATKIREKTGGSQTYKPAEIPDGIEEVYSSGLAAGHEQGYSDGYSLGESAGRQAEYDAFWDAFQESGNRTNYSLAFSGRAWVDSIFKPKYNINVVGYAENLFSQTGIADVKGLLEANGVALDISGATTLAYCFYNSLVTRLPVMDCSGVNRDGGMTSLLQSCSNLVSIDKVIMPDPTSISNYNMLMSGCSKLETVVIEGVIGKSGLNMRASTKLSHDSIVSIINALSATTNGLSITLSATAVNNAFETSEGASDGSTSEAWLSLVATKSNWTISLV